MKTLLLFDIDGTLLLTGGAGKIAFEKAFFDLFGASGVWGNTRPDGRTDPDLIDEIARRALGRLLLPEENERLIEAYHACFRDSVHCAVSFRLMPGIPDILERLAANADILMGVATGNFETAARLKLERAGIAHYFPFGGYGSDSRNRFELTRIAFERGLARNGGGISRERVFVIGDTVHDIRAARLLGARAVGVATGRSTREELAAENPDYCFENLEKADAFLSQFFGS